MWKRRPIRIAVAAPGILLAAGTAFWALLPWPVRLGERNPETTSLILHRQEQARSRGRDLEVRHTWVALEEISPHLRRAVVVAEDHRFRTHRGIDWKALAEELAYGGDAEFSATDPHDVRALVDAARYLLAHRSELKGRSTITQQLAKNLYFDPERSLLRKAKELVVARRLERFLDKDRILELYLNVAEWGPGIFGAEAAARAYFGVPARELTLRQAASLAATLPHPLTSNPALRPGRMAWRRNLIMDRLLGDGSRSRPGPLPVPEIEIAVPGGLESPPAAVDSVLPDSAVSARRSGTQRRSSSQRRQAS